MAFKRESFQTARTSATIKVKDITQTELERLVHLLTEEWYLNFTAEYKTTETRRVEYKNYVPWQDIGTEEDQWEEINR